MKLRNYFFGALACLALASCSSDDDAIDSGQEGKDGVACIAVKITMPESGITRGWNDSDQTLGQHQSGDENEIKINNIVLYFFDASGKQWDNPREIELPTINNTTDGVDDTDKTIESSTEAFVIFNNTTNLPASVIAVLNAPETDGKAKIYTATTVETLRNNISDDWTAITQGGFIMSNAVYVNDETTQYAVSLTEKLITGTVLSEVQEEAKKSPVEIYVERVLARVSVDLLNDSKKKISSEEKEYQMGYSSTDKATIVSIVDGWWLDRTAQKSYLLKDLSSTYSQFSDSWWNSVNYKRSYWANNVADQTFAHYDYSNNTWGDKYCFENVDQTNYTQLVVAATLYERTGTEGAYVYTPISLVEHKTVKWRKADFLNEAINIIKIYSDAAHTTPITSDKLSIVANNKNTNYQVGGTDNKTNIEPWQGKLVIADGTYYDNQGNELTQAEAQELLDKEIGAFKYWNNGKTYYYTGIQHNETDDDSKHAIIRNHKYVIDVTSITGLGTPVPYDPNDPNDANPDTPKEDPDTPPTTPEPDYPDDPEFPGDSDDPSDDDDDPTDPSDDDNEDPIVPEKPTDDKVSSMAAKIYVLQYRVVSQSVDLQ